MSNMPIPVTPIKKKKVKKSLFETKGWSPPTPEQILEFKSDITAINKNWGKEYKLLPNECGMLFAFDELEEENGWTRYYFIDGTFVDDFCGKFNPYKEKHKFENKNRKRSS